MAVIKQTPIISKPIRSAARGEECTFNIPGVCTYDPDKTVLCHLPDESHGMARKSDDISAAFGCAECHGVIDGRNYNMLLSPEDRQFYMKRAMVRTWRRLIEKGIITIKGYKN